MGCSFSRKSSAKFRGALLLAVWMPAMQPAVQPAVEQGLVECDVESFHRVCPEQERGIDWLELFTLACANCFDSACFEHANLLVRLSTALDVLNSEENYAWECNVGVAAVAMMAQHLFFGSERSELDESLRKLEGPLSPFPFRHEYFSLYESYRPVLPSGVLNKE